MQPQNVVFGGNNQQIPNNQKPSKFKDKTKVLVFLGILGLILICGGVVTALEINRQNFEEVEKSQSKTNSDPPKTQGRASDSESKTDINAIHAQLEAHYATDGWYPSQVLMNDPKFRDQRLLGLSEDATITPKGKDPVFVNSATIENYQYTASQCSADGSKCQKYELSALLGDGSKYTKLSLN